MGEAYYPYDGRIWARWETDFLLGNDNLAHCLAQLTRIRTSTIAATRRLTVVLPSRKCRVLTPEHPIFHQVFDLGTRGLRPVVL